MQFSPYAGTAPALSMGTPGTPEKERHGPDTDLPSASCRMIFAGERPDRNTPARTMCDAMQQIRNHRGVPTGQR